MVTMQDRPAPLPQPPKGRPRQGWRLLPAALACLPAALARGFAALGALFLAERGRWLLWLPVFYGGGIGFYFLLPTEPPAWLGGLLLAATLLGLALLRLMPAGLARLRQDGLVLALILPFVTCAAGFAVAQWQAREAAAPVLSRQVGPVMIAGRITAVEPQERAGQWRITLTDTAFPGREGRLPRLRKARVTVRTGGVEPVVGDTVQVLATLFPPGAPDLPGGFDFARSAWFQQLGAVGFSVSPLAERAAPAAESGIARRISEGIARMRGDVTARILAAMPHPEGAVAAALLTGVRGAIPEPVVASYRDSGIAHLLAISGLHLALVAGLLFFGLRAVLAAWPHLALRMPIKKWAALFALAGALAYLVLTGAAVSTQRATLMAGLVLLAVLLDRQAISMRSVAWAAFIVLTLAPESLMSPGFQMSFSAVVALIGAYEGQRWGRVTQSLADRGGWPAQSLRLLLYLAAILVTTVIAGLATAPYAAFHFHRLVDYGQIANLVAVPLTSLWVMPLGVLAYILMPLGLEALALVPMGWGIAVVNGVAAEISSWPGAVRSIPAMPMSALLAMTLGALWLLLWRRPWRVAGMGGIALGVWLAAGATPPDLLVDGEGRTMAVRLGQQLVFQDSAALRRRTAQSWTRATGLEGHSPWPAHGRHPLSDADAALTCDLEGCLYERAGKGIALPFSQDALARDCRHADLVLASFAVLQPCPRPERVIDARTLYREGAITIRIRPEGQAIVATAAEQRGRRLWSGADPP